MLPRLHTLELTLTHTHAFLRGAAAACPRLKRLLLINCYDVDCADLLPLTSLTSLSVSYCKCVIELRST